MMMNGFDTNFDADNEVYAVNTVAHHFMHDPIRVEVGKLVRMYVINVTEFDLINSIHLHGMFFDAYRTGTSLTPSESTDTLMLCQGERGNPRDPLPVSGQVHVPRSPERVRRARVDGPVRSHAGCAVTHDTLTERAPVARIWTFAVLPLVLLAGLLFLLMRSGAAGWCSRKECRRSSGW